MKALISPQQDDFVVQVVKNSDIFDVAKPLYWVDCTTVIKAYEFKYKNLEFVAYVPPSISAEENKATAMNLLQQTDWTTIPDVGDPTKSNPYLANVNEFVVYRNAIRQYAINPIAGNIDWAVKPNENWQSV